MVALKYTLNSENKLKRIWHAIRKNAIE